MRAHAPSGLGAEVPHEADPEAAPAGAAGAEDEVAVEVGALPPPPEGAGAAEAVLGGKPASKVAKQLWRAAVDSVIDGQTTEEKLTFTISRAMALKEQVMDMDIAALSSVDKTTRVMLDNTQLPTGPLALLMTLLRPGNDKMIKASSKLTQHVWKQHSFFFVTASLVLLLWVGGVVCTPALVSLALRLAYNGTGMAKLDLAMFVAWFSIYAIMMAGIK